jgi:hypothetical protein
MNQTKKRLAIIKLAISMTDTETIQLQVLKLGLLKTDSKMRDILAMLNDHNYAQAQRLISAYIESPTETTIIQRTSQDEKVIPEEKPLPKEVPPTPEEAMLEAKEPILEEEKPLTLKEKIQQAKDQAIIEQFELFTEESEEKIEEVQEEVSYDALLDIAPKPKQMSTEKINYDALLNVTPDDVLPDNIELDISEEPKNDFFKEKLTIVQDKEDKDNFFDNTEELEKPVESNIKDIVTQENFVNNSFEDKNLTPLSSDNKSMDNDVNTEKKDTTQTSDTQYKSISYIDQKFKNMLNQYPLTHNTNESFSSVDTWLVQISNAGYTEAEVEKVIKQTESLSQTNKSEAAQLLLITAATESKYAQFRLARALYKGEILQKNLPEAFTLINRLALNDDYPEAICDLAQFYEKGIGIAKDKKKAESLYKEAMDLGIQRAMDHYDRIRKENKSLLSIFKK